MFVFFLLLREGRGSQGQPRHRVNLCFIAIAFVDGASAVVFFSYIHLAGRVPRRG